MRDSMAYRIPTIEHLVNTRAYPLGYQGREIGWTRGDALRVISELGDTDIGILGGDVWHLVNGKATHAYANWHSEPGGGETPHNFAVRSRAEANEYISQYPETSETYYVLVFSQ